IHRRREPVRSEKLNRPALPRSVSEPIVNRWRRAKRPERHCPWDIHKELEDLVIASKHHDCDEDDEEGEAADGGRTYHLPEVWLRKPTRKRGQARRTKSDG
ncbi:hypothetical protein BDW02DRAFT_463942, partial [Decorospora gaudefroyi]